MDKPKNRRNADGVRKAEKTPASAVTLLNSEVAVAYSQR
jgi:hypothetical protein